MWAPEAEAVLPPETDLGLRANRPEAPVVTQSVTHQITIADLLDALHDAFLEEFEDEELADLAVQTLVEERLLEGAWQFPAPEDVN